jgi:hypothetical protein
VSQCDSGAEHAFAADQAHLERHAPFGDAEQRHQAVVRKIDVTNRVTRLAQHFPHLDLDWLEQWRQAREIVVRQGSQQQVAVFLRRLEGGRKIHQRLATRLRVLKHFSRLVAIIIRSHVRNGALLHLQTI